MHVKFRPAFIRHMLRDGEYNIALALLLGAAVRRATLRAQLEAQRAARAAVPK